MDIECLKTGRHFTSADAVSNCVKEHSHCNTCPYDKKKQFEREMKPIRETGQREEAQQSLNRILSRLEQSEIVKETEDYKLLVCPICHKPSLFYSKHNGNYECLIKVSCGLNSTIRFLTEKAKRRL